MSRAVRRQSSRHGSGSVTAHRREAIDGGPNVVEIIAHCKEITGPSPLKFFMRCVGKPEDPVQVAALRLVVAAFGVSRSIA